MEWVTVLAWALLVGPFTGAAWAWFQWQREAAARTTDPDPEPTGDIREDPTAGEWAQPDSVLTYTR